jgi:predicted dithiol-disulfide oxidoreductase (DUF899 family)
MARNARSSVRKEIAAAEKALLRQMKALAKLRRKAPPEPIEDAELLAEGGRSVHLSELFGGKNDLILIHNMGKDCNYCTLWADGFNGQARHLEDRAAFVVVSPDDPATQAKFAASRGWTFKMVTDPGGRFSATLGYGEGDGGIYPGVSTFRRGKGGAIEHVASTPFGPGDIYNPAFNLFDLLAGGVGDWTPKSRYR